MKTVWKYSLPAGNGVAYDMPVGHKVLAVQVQDNLPQLWALVDTDAPRAVVRFMIYGTGQEIRGDAGTHVGTFQALGGSLVFHVFEQGVEQAAQQEKEPK